MKRAAALIAILSLVGTGSVLAQQYQGGTGQGQGPARAR